MCRLSQRLRLALRPKTLLLADLPVALGDLHALLDGLRVLDEGRDHAEREVPLDVAVEEPHARVVRLEAEDCRAEPVNSEGVPPHRHLRIVLLLGVREPGVDAGAREDLDVVAVQVEGVVARREVVQRHLDHLVLLVNEGVDLAVGLGIRCVVTCSEGRVEAGRLRRRVADVVEEGTASHGQKMDFFL